MEYASFILATLSAATIIITILFEGKLKKKDKTYAIFNSLTIIGWFLIALSLLISFGNGYTNYKSIVDNNVKNKADTTRIHNLLVLALDKNKSDKVKIDSLIMLTKKNGQKSDSIKYSVLENGVKAINEQNKRIERERENIFIHLQKEVKDNLAKILFDYDEKTIRGLVDANKFPSSKLSDIYINKYEEVSNKKIIIENFMKLAELITQLNDYSDVLLSESDNKMRAFVIKNFLQTSEEIYNRSLSIYARINNLKSYKEYESFDFTKRPTSFDKQQLKDSLIFEVSYLILDKKKQKELWNLKDSLDKKK